MDFDQMTDILNLRLGIPVPGIRSQEEIKFLMCLDYKYLEMVMLIKFDKIMQDLDYISIDLLRQVQDQEMEQSRQMAISELRRLREKQLSHLKDLQAQKSANQNLNFNQNTNNQGLNDKISSQAEIQGVSLSSKQEKKRKRPDDKKQNLQKKQLSSITNQEFSGSNNQNEISDKAYSQKTKNQIMGKSNYDQSYSNGSAKISGGQINSQSGGIMLSGSLQVKERYTQSKNQVQDNKLDQEIDDIYDEVQEESNQISNDRVNRSQYELEIKKKKFQQIDQIQDQAVVDDDFDNIDVNLDRDVHNSTRFQKKEQQDNQNSNLNPSEEDYLQDDIPVDYDDEENEEGIISDNYENFEDKVKMKLENQRISDQSIQYVNSTKNNKNIQQIVENEQEIQKSDSQDFIRQSFSQKSNEKNQNDEHLISMDHSDDLEDSSPVPNKNKKGYQSNLQYKNEEQNNQQEQKQKSQSIFDEQSEQELSENEIQQQAEMIKLQKQQLIQHEKNEQLEFQQENQNYEENDNDDADYNQSNNQLQDQLNQQNYKDSHVLNRQSANNQIQYQKSQKSFQQISISHSQISSQKKSESIKLQSSRKELTRQSHQKIDPNILMNLQNEQNEDNQQFYEEYDEDQIQEYQNEQQEYGDELLEEDYQNDLQFQQLEPELISKSQQPNDIQQQSFSQSQRDKQQQLQDNQIQDQFNQSQDLQNTSYKLQNTSQFHQNQIQNEDSYIEKQDDLNYENQDQNIDDRYSEKQQSIQKSIQKEQYSLQKNQDRESSIQSSKAFNQGIKQQIQLPQINKSKSIHPDEFEEIDQQIIEQQNISKQVSKQEEYSQVSQKIESEKVLFYENNKLLKKTTTSQDLNYNDNYELNNQSSDNYNKTDVHNFEEQQEIQFDNQEIPDDDIDAEPSQNQKIVNEYNKDANSEVSRLKTAEIKKQLEGDFSDEYIDDDYAIEDQIENFNQINLNQRGSIDQSKTEYIVNKQNITSHEKLRLSQKSSQNSKVDGSFKNQSYSISLKGSLKSKQSQKEVDLIQLNKKSQSSQKVNQNSKIEKYDKIEQLNEEVMQDIYDDEFI